MELFNRPVLIFHFTEDVLKEVVKMFIKDLLSEITKLLHFRGDSKVNRTFVHVIEEYSLTVCGAVMLPGASLPVGTGSCLEVEGTVDPVLLRTKD